MRRESRGKAGKAGKAGQGAKRNEESPNPNPNPSPKFTLTLFMKTLFTVFGSSVSEIFGLRSHPILPNFEDGPILQKIEVLESGKNEGSS